MKLFATFTVLAVFVAASLLHVPNAMADKPSATSNNQSVNVQFEETDSTVKVMLGGQHFTTFDFGNYAKPILYPILGPNQTGMTRNWPMNKDVKGEAHDHPHHKSMWISHEISGVDFWAETEGKVKTNRVEISQSEKNMFRATSSWIKKDDGEQLLTDHTEYHSELATIVAGSIARSPTMPIKAKSFSTIPKKAFSPFALIPICD